MGSSPDTLDALREAERETWREIQESMPERLARDTLVDPGDIQRRIGITGAPSGPRGYIRYLNADFVVEEVGIDGVLSAIEPTAPPPLPRGNPTLFADLVKIGMGTTEAVAQLANGLGILREKIGYAGMKDARAITSQRVSIRGLTDSTDVSSRRFPQIFVKPTHTGKGALSAGQLRGNRFTILVRTEEPVDEAWLSERAEDLRKDGFANFYGVQRFGNRLLNPQLGKLLCQGNIDAALRVFLTEAGPFDIPLYRDIRTAAQDRYPNWRAMHEVYNELPYTFRHERAVLEILMENPSDARRALLAIADQVRFWVYGYTSLLVNRVLSAATAGARDIPDPLPIPLGGSRRTDEFYTDMLQEDGTTEYLRHLRPFPFLVQKPRTILPWILPEIHGTAPITAGAILDFTLPKAVYATTFLLFLFRVYEGSPVPAWVRPDAVDTKATLGTGSVTAALERLGVSVDRDVEPQAGEPNTEGSS